MASKDSKYHQRIYKSAKKSVKESLRGIGNFLVRQSTLPDQPVMDPGDFPWTSMLEEKSPVIRKELDRVLEFRNSIPKVYDVQREQYRISSDDKWKVFMLSGWGHVSRTGERLCPETARIVKEIPGLRSAFFSILEPGAFLLNVKNVFSASRILFVTGRRASCWFSTILIVMRFRTTLRRNGLCCYFILNAR